VTEPPPLPPALPPAPEPQVGAVPLEYRGPAFASWGKRVAASVLDSAIGAAVTFLAFGDVPVDVPFMGATFLTPEGGNAPAISFTDSGWVVGAAVTMMAMQAYLGVTPGKLAAGIAVVGDRDARPIGLLRTVVRWFAHILDSILLIGYLRPLWNAERRTFADTIMGTIVLDTRRPRRHARLARSLGSRPDPGPPASWEAPIAPRWWPAATAIATVACVVGVLFSFDPLGGPGSGPVTQSCEMTAPDVGLLLTGGTLVTPGPTTTTRLGVTRHLRGTGGHITATWEWSSPQPAGSNARLRISFARADGTVVRKYEYTPPPDEVGKVTITLPDNALQDLGDAPTWTQTIFVDGVESPGCTGSTQGSDG
jgi:Mce-associated membrane protein